MRILYQIHGIIFLIFPNADYKHALQHYKKKKLTMEMAKKKGKNSLKVS